MKKILRAERRLVVLHARSHFLKNSFYFYKTPILQDFLDELSILDESYLGYFCNYQKECLCEISNSYFFTFYYKVIPLKEIKTLNKILDELFIKYPKLQKFKCNRHELIFTENQIYHTFKQSFFFIIFLVHFYFSNFFN